MKKVKRSKKKTGFKKNSAKKLRRPRRMQSALVLQTIPSVTGPKATGIVRRSTNYRNTMHVDSMGPAPKHESIGEGERLSVRWMGHYVTLCGSDATLPAAANQIFTGTDDSKHIVYYKYLHTLGSVVATGSSADPYLSTYSCCWKPETSISTKLSTRLQLFRNMVWRRLEVKFVPSNIGMITGNIALGWSASTREVLPEEANFRSIGEMSHSITYSMGNTRPGAVLRCIWDTDLSKPASRLFDHTFIDGTDYKNWDIQGRLLGACSVQPSGTVLNQVIGYLEWSGICDCYGPMTLNVSATTSMLTSQPCVAVSTSADETKSCNAVTSSSKVEHVALPTSSSSSIMIEDYVRVGRTAQLVKSFEGLKLPKS